MTSIELLNITNDYQDFYLNGEPSDFYWDSLTDEESSVIIQKAHDDFVDMCTHLGVLYVKP